jgi:hypothetical protein
MGQNAKDRGSFQGVFSGTGHRRSLNGASHAIAIYNNSRMSMYINCKTTSYSSIPLLFYVKQVLFKMSSINIYFLIFG